MALLLLGGLQSSPLMSVCSDAVFIWSDTLVFWFIRLATLR